jgi:ParB family chromosome partitioning protein
MLQAMSLPIETIDVDPVQADRQRGTEGLRRLTESVARLGILQPVGVKPAQNARWRAVYGNGRILAAIGAGLKAVPANILDEKTLADGVGVVQLVENMLRTDLTGYEQWQGCLEALKQNPNWTYRELSERLSIDQSSITRIMSPLKVILPWQEALKAGKVGISDCYAASKIPEADQAALLALKLSGASRDQLEKAGRKARTTTPTAAKLSRIPVKLPGGASVVIAGREMSLDEVIDTLSEVMKAARKARDEGLSVKSWTALMKDKSKKAEPGNGSERGL